MPGTVTLVVLEVVDLPPAAAGKKYVVRVKCGSRQNTSAAQAAFIPLSGPSTIRPFNAEFSFPVLNLQDPLEVSLVDVSSGQELGQGKIAVSSVVEKGSKDEMLQLSNSGRIRVKSAFLLTEEERAKIAAMRAKAMQRREQKGDAGIISPQGTTTAPVLPAVVPQDAPPADPSPPPLQPPPPTVAQPQPPAQPLVPNVAKPEPPIERPAPVEKAAPPPETKPHPPLEKATPPTEAKPDRPVQKTEPPVQKPEPPVAKPEPPVEKPAPTTAKPEPSIREPAPVVAKPEPLAEKPAPIEAKSEPPIQTPAPAVAKLDPSVKKPEPPVQPPTPEVAKSDPIPQPQAPQATKPQTEAPPPKPRQDHPAPSPKPEPSPASTPDSYVRPGTTPTQRPPAPSPPAGTERVSYVDTTPMDPVKERIAALEVLRQEVENAPVGSVTRAQASERLKREIEATTAAEAEDCQRKKKLVARSWGGGGESPWQDEGLKKLAKQVAGGFGVLLGVAMLWPRGKKGREYTVRKGDHLCGIVPQHYCNPKSRFFELNPEVCDVNYIFEGQRLRLP